MQHGSLPHIDFNRTVVALARYQSIIDQPDSGELDYDSVDPGTTKPTKSAIRVNDVLETITGIYCASLNPRIRWKNELC